MLTRRDTLASAAAGLTLALPQAVRAQSSDPFSGATLFADVQQYSSFGVHRTATAGDDAVTGWLSKRLASFGYAVDTQDVPYPLFEPQTCEIRPQEGQAVSLFPTWPVVPTEATSAKLCLPDRAEGGIAVIDIAALRSGALEWPGIGDAFLAAEKRGAKAVIGLCGGPTGDVVAQNASFKQFAWTIPVLVAPGRARQRLLDGANRGESWTLVSTGKQTPDAKGQNVIARRRGIGKTICVSTPKSGWFTCAGERGTGIAAWLALAKLLSSTKADLLFVATSGHELNNLGQKFFLDARAPSPDSVRFWLHLGANIAVSDVSVTQGIMRPSGNPVTTRSAMASSELLPAIRTAFRGVPGYEQPQDVAGVSTLGELTAFHRRGYHALCGLVGSGPLFHTPQDVAVSATTPEILEPVARSLGAFMNGIAAG